MWERIKAPFNYVKDKWLQFRGWVATWFPGLKTKFIAALGSVSSVAVLLQEYVSGLPLDRLVSEKTLAIVGAVLFTLAFWFRGMKSSED